MNSTPTAGKRQVTLKTTLMVGLLSISAVLVGILAAQSSSLALLLLLGIIVWIALAKYYELALAALLVGFFAYPVALGLFGLAISSVKTATFYALLATAALAGGIARHPERLHVIFRRRGTLVGLAMAIWTVVNFTMFSLGNNLALTKLGLMAFLMVIPLIAGQFITERELRRFYWLCIGLVLIGTVLTLHNLLLADPSGTDRISVTENISPLGFAYSAGLVALMSLGLLGSGGVTTVKKLLLGTQLAGTAIVIVASGSRGPLLALAVGIAVLLFRTSWRTRTYYLVATVVLVIIAWWTLSLVPDIVYARWSLVASAATSGGLGSAFDQSCARIWRLSLSAWQTAPLFGIGLGNFLGFGQEIANFSHNFIIETLTELGLVGLSILSIFLWIVGGRAIRMLRQRDTSVIRLSLVAALAYTLVSMTFSGQLHASVDFWMVSAFILSLNHSDLSLEQSVS